MAMLSIAQPSLTAVMDENEKLRTSLKDMLRLVRGYKPAAVVGPCWCDELPWAVKRTVPCAFCEIQAATALVGAPE